MMEEKEVPVSKYLTTNLGFTGVEVLVGEGKHQKRFLVHKTLVTSRSEFFARALGGSWREAEDNMVELPEDEPEIFGLYLHLLYTGKFPPKDIAEMKKDAAKNYKVKSGENEVESCSKNDSSSSTTSSTSSTSRYSNMSGHRKISDSDRRNYNQSCGLDFMPLSKLFVLSEKLQDTVAKNSVIDAFIEESQRACESHFHMPNSSEINIIYNGTPETSLLRKFLVDIHINYMIDMDAKCANFPKQFIFDVMVGMSRRRICPLEKGNTADGSRYHTEIGAKREKSLCHSSSSQKDKN